ncbi:hypothetical protein AAHH67_20870 [Niallia circulans]
MDRSASVQDAGEQQLEWLEKSLRYKKEKISIVFFPSEKKQL